MKLWITLAAAVMMGPAWTTAGAQTQQPPEPDAPQREYEQAYEPSRPPRPAGQDTDSLPALARQLTLAEMDAADAQQQLDEARQAVPSRARLRNQFEDTPEYRAAVANLARAQLQFDRARRAALATAHQDPQYRQAAQQRDRVEAELDAVRPAASPETLYYLATKKLEYAQQASRHELNALNSHPQVRENLGQVVTAAGNLRGLNEQFTDTWQRDPQRLEALANVEQARNRYDSTMRELIATRSAYDHAAQQAYAQARLYDDFYDVLDYWSIRNAWWYPDGRRGRFVQFPAGFNFNVFGWGGGRRTRSVTGQ